MSLESNITPSADGTYELRLKGRIHRPHWVVQLFASLSQQHVSIISGQALQEKPGEWSSRFVLDFSNSTADPKQLDYAAYTEQAAPTERSSTLPKLSRYEISRRADQLVEVRLEGPDQIGFLASILGRVAVLAMFPAALEINTLRGEIRDNIVLRGIGDRGPSDAAYQSLDRMLKSFIVS